MCVTFARVDSPTPSTRSLKDAAAHATSPTTPCCNLSRGTFSANDSNCTSVSTASSETAAHTIEPCEIRPSRNAASNASLSSYRYESTNKGSESLMARSEQTPYRQ